MFFHQEGEEELVVGSGNIIVCRKKILILTDYRVFFALILI